VTVRQCRVSVQVTVPGAGTMRGLLKARIGTRMMTIAQTGATPTAAGAVTLRFRVSSQRCRSLARTVGRRRTGRTSGNVQLTFQRLGALPLRRTRAVSVTTP
jgi:hypothetical protein